MEQIRYVMNNSGIEEEIAFSRETVDDIFIPLLKHMADLQRDKGKRILVMLAAPPGAGKTTMLSFLQYLSTHAEELSPDHSKQIRPITIIGMDGFHRYQDYLLTHTMMRSGEEITMVKVKGAPETFDLPLLLQRVRRVAEGECCGWPTYDRLLHNPVEDAITIDSDIILMEGNYLLLNWEGWSELSQYADYTIKLIAEEELLRKRLLSRKMSTGVEEAAAAAFVDYSDMYNVRTCLKDSKAADLVLEITEVDGQTLVQRKR